MRLRRAVALLVLGLAQLQPPLGALAETKTGGSGGAAGPPSTSPRVPDRLTRTAAEVVRTTRQYRESLDRLLQIRERDFAELSAREEEARAQLGQRPEARAELEEILFALEPVRERLEEVRAWINEADQLLAEAIIIEELSKLPRLAVGGYVETPMLMRYNGAARFTLDDLPAIERFFLDTFKRALPVSARGQSALHDRMGLDHRNAVDVAVHPDGPEGRSLMAYLRQIGVPFIGVRGAVPGASTGAHVHIGQPSPRLIMVRPR
jgi:hypothetical protein